MIPDEDRIREYGNISAGHAAGAIGTLIGRVVWMDPPRCRTVAPGDLPLELFPTDERVAAVFLDLDGAVRGIAGLMIPASEVADLLEPLVGPVSAERFDARARSAFGEIGNIALCAAVSAMAVLTGETIHPSAPRIGLDRPGALLTEALHATLRALPSQLVESDLSVRDSRVRVRFLWVPLP
jgi:chemotaxis protein CheC